MLHVWTTHRRDQLAARLATSLRAQRADRPPDLFERPCIVVPGPHVASYLKFAIARSTGIVAHLDCPSLDEFLASLVPANRPELRPLSRAALIHVLAAVLADDAELPPIVRWYLEIVPAGDARELRRFQLANRLAELFTGYALWKPDLLSSWRAGVSNEDPAAWQADIWRCVFGGDGRLSQVNQRGESQWFGSWDILDYLPLAALQLPRQLTFFGFGYLPSAVLSLLHRCTERCDITLLTPRADPASATDSLLLDWAAPGIAFVDQLGKLPDADRQSDDQRPEPTNLLQCIQSGLPRADAKLGPAPDSSLTVLACPGIRREVEIIASEIWEMVRQDTSLRFSDIALLIADSRNAGAYQTDIQSVFAEMHDLPCSLTDLPVLAAGQSVDAVQQLLSLPLGSFRRPELLRLLTHPCVLARFPDADADAWRDWCEHLMIVHGADHEDHRDLYIAKDLFNWDQGLHRLALGAFMAGQRSGDERAVKLSQQEYLPEDFTADQLGDAARLVLLVRSMTADARFARDAKLTLTQWSDFLGGLIRAYLGAASSADEAILTSCRDTLYRLREADVDGRLLPYRQAYELARAALAGLKGGTGPFLARGVAVAPLAPARVLPFRVIIVCGLGEGRFPARTSQDPLDLGAGLSARDRDKFVFLETIGAARDRLVLSYVARDAQTGEELAASSVILELFEELRRIGLSHSQIDQITVKHPLRRYDDCYFRSASGRLPNASPAARAEAQAVGLHEALAPTDMTPRRLTINDRHRLGAPLSRWLGLCPLPPPSTSGSAQRTISLSLSALRQFLECPLQGWARHCLALPDEDDDNMMEREDENFATPSFELVTVLREVFCEAIEHDPRNPPWEQLWRARAHYHELRGTMPTGLFRSVEQRRQLAILEQWNRHFQNLNLDFDNSPPPTIWRLGRAAEHGRVAHLRPPVVVDVDASLRVELYGRTELLHRDKAMSLTLVPGNTAKKKHFLRGFIDSVILAVTDGHDAQTYRSVVLPNGPQDVLEFPTLSHSAALSYLQAVLADLLTQPHEYLLPCEAVLAWMEPKNGRSLEAIMDKLLSDRDCSSCYGPVSDPNHYAVPGDNEARAIVNRRYEPFLRHAFPSK
jgi:exodeoxyribonuclease V gamma subunit